MIVYNTIQNLALRKAPNLQRWTSATAKMKTRLPIRRISPLLHVSWPRQGSAIVCPCVLLQQLCTTLLFERWKANIVQRPKPLLSGSNLVATAIASEEKIRVCPKIMGTHWSPLAKQYDAVLDTASRNRCELYQDFKFVHYPIFNSDSKSHFVPASGSSIL